MKKLNKTALFLILTFIICYTMIAIFYFMGGKLQSTSGFIITIIYMFIPALSVFIVEKLIHKEKLVQTAGVSFNINIWFLVAWLITPLISFSAFGISLLFHEVSFSPDMEGMYERYAITMAPEQIEQMKTSAALMPVPVIWITLIQGLIAGITINAVAGFGEELGWRGFLLRQFRNMPFLKASVIIGFIWGVWHAPVILLGHNYPQHPQFGVLMMTLWCILLTPLFLYITIKSKSVIAASVMHGTLNGTAGVAIILIKGGNDLFVGVTGLAGFIALILVNVLFFIYDNWITKEKIMNGVIREFI
ncbi:MAG: CPBP family intramembrane metalloprotease [Bacteroidales bacterium]|nr:CPBP family intramembrane metalloprotease [Bacteroidales bacterium]